MAKKIFQKIQKFIIKYKYFDKNKSFPKKYKKYIESITNKLFFLLFLIPFTPLLYLNRLLPSHLRIYFAGFRSDRIGHFLTGFHIRYAKKKLNLINKNCIYYFNEYISNKFLAHQVRRSFPTYWFVRYLVMICERLPFLDCLNDKEPIRGGMSGKADQSGLILKADMPKFTKNEDAFAFDWLNQNGWEGPSQKIVCLHVRDSEYLNNFFPGFNWDYQSVRDANIYDFTDTINWLIKKDIFVIRTGKVSKSKLKIKSKYLVDYPFCKNQNDLLDIWLLANSNLVISTATGFPESSYAYKVPIIYVNYMPLGQAHSWKKSLTIGKHLIWEESNKHLNLSDYIKVHDCFKSQDYKDLKIRIKDLSREELLATVKDGYNYFIEGISFKKDDMLITDMYKKIIKSSKDLDKYHDYFNPEFVLSSNLFKSQ